MIDEDDAADQQTVAAEDMAAASIAQPSPGVDQDLAWSLGDCGDGTPLERHSWGLVWAQAAVFVSIGAVFAFVLGVVGWVLVHAHHDPRRATPVVHRSTEFVQTTRVEVPAAVAAAPSTVTVEATPPTVTVKVTPPAVTVNATPPTVTVQAPTSTIAPPRQWSATAPRAADTLYDQRFLDQMRSLGYVILNPQVMLRNAHEACRLFRLGESSSQVNQQMSQQMRTTMTDTMQLTSSAMLAYPDCY